MKQLSAIVLAAGLSQRMGDKNKMLLSFRNKTVIQSVVENILAAGIHEVIAVTGFEADKINTVLNSLPVKIIYNPDYENGMTTSIQAGVQPATGNGYMICLGDMVTITPGEYAFLKNKFEDCVRQNEKAICIPLYKNTKGNPVIFSSYYKDAILRHTEMEGCKGIVQANKENIYWAEMQTEHVLQDMDYLHEYEMLNKE